MKKFLPWVLGVLILVVGLGTVYFAVKHSQRSAANWPQVQIAQDQAASLDRGAEPHSFYGKTDMAKSLAPFIIIYDKKGSAIDGSGYLDGKLPRIEKDELEASKDEDYRTLTWSPKDDVNIAAVIVEAKDYYVLSGRNLSEVEKNQSATLQIVLIGLIISLLLLGGMYAAVNLNDETAY